jgi:hypothetical protein
MEQRLRQSWKKQEVPNTHKNIFSNDYIKSLTVLLKLRPTTSTFSSIKQIQAVYWTNWYIGYQLLKENDAAKASRKDFPSVLDHPTLPITEEKKDADTEDTSTGSVDCMTSLTHAIEFICTILQRIHQEQNNSNYPPLVAPSVAVDNIMFHGDVFNVLIHTLRFISKKPNFAHIWNKLRETFQVIIPESLSLSLSLLTFYACIQYSTVFMNGIYLSRVVPERQNKSSCDQGLNFNSAR